MKRFTIAIVMPSGEQTFIRDAPADSIRQVALVFWQMWLQPELPQSVFIEETLS